MNPWEKSHTFFNRMPNHDKKRENIEAKLEKIKKVISAEEKSSGVIENRVKVEKSIQP